MGSSSRDDFTKATIETLADRAGNRCSNPNCRKPTSGPRTDPTKAVNIGVAAHITAASEGGPRYDPSLTSEERRHPDNGIWLCQNCAKLIDNDPQRYPVGLLRQWKEQAEHAALQEIEHRIPPDLMHQQPDPPRDPTLDTSGSAPLIDPDDPPIASIRKLLLAAFTPETLRRFCQDRPVFRPITHEFGAGHGLNDMVDEVIDYCQTRILFPELLDEIRVSNPRQYELYRAQVHISAPTQETVAQVPTPQPEPVASEASTTPDTDETTPPMPTPTESSRSQASSALFLRPGCLQLLLLGDFGLMLLWLWCLLGHEPDAVNFIGRIVVPLVVAAGLVLALRERIEDALRRIGTDRRLGLAVMLVTVLFFIITLLFWPLGVVGNCRPEPIPTSAPTFTATSTHTSSPSPTSTNTPTSTPTSTISPTPTDSATPIGAPPCTTIGDTWTRPADSMEMVCVPAGEFLMGSTDADSQARDDEKPQRTIYLDAFWIDMHEVTNGQYRMCVEAGACSEPDCWDDNRFGGQDQPVICVGWDGAVAYADWVDGRLPTEAEWEKAARGTDGRIYPWGNDLPDCDHAVYRGCSDIPLSVGSRLEGASPYGALDMVGNVWEWVADWYDEYPLGSTSNPGGPGSGGSRAARGGSYFNRVERIRCAARMGVYPDHQNDGFRVAMPASSTGP